MKARIYSSSFSLATEDKSDSITPGMEGRRRQQSLKRVSGFICLRVCVEGGGGNRMGGRPRNHRG